MPMEPQTVQLQFATSLEESTRKWNPAHSLAFIVGAFIIVTPIA